MVKVVGLVLGLGSWLTPEGSSTFFGLAILMRVLVVETLCPADGPCLRCQKPTSRDNNLAPAASRINVNLWMQLESPSDLYASAVAETLE